MKTIIALVGLPGSGKSSAAQMFTSKGFTVIRLGKITDEEILKRGEVINEENEKKVREELRKKHGMDAYAKLNLEKIERYERAVIDGLRSFEEYTFFKNRFGKAFHLVLIDMEKELRYKRLGERKVRPLPPDEMEKRDKREIENLGVGRTIGYAEKAINNNGTLEELEEKINQLIL